VSRRARHASKPSPADPSATALPKKQQPIKRELLSFGDLALPMSSELAAALEFAIDCPSASLQLQPHDLADPLLCESLGHHQRRGIAKALLRELARRLRDSDYKTHWLNREILWSLNMLDKLRGHGKRALRRAGCTKIFGMQRLSGLVTVPGLDPLSLAALLRFSVPTAPSNSSSTVVVTREDCSRSKRSDASNNIRVERTVPPRIVKLSTGLKMSTHDPRFGQQLQLVLEGQPNALEKLRPTIRLDAAEAHCELSNGSTGLHALTHALQAASRMTVADELRALATAGASNTREPARTTDMVCMRYGTNTRAHSLAEVAMAFGSTKQSVAVLIQRCISPPDVPVYAPALRQLLASVDAQRGRPVAVVEHELRPQLGASQSLSGALAFAKEFLGLTVDRTTATKTFAKKSSPVTMLNADNIVATAIAKEINRSIRLTGFAVVSSICHAVSQARKVFVSQRQYEDLVEATPTLLWVHREHGVATSAGANNPLRISLLRCLVAGQPHGVAEHELVAALRRGVLGRTVVPTPVTDAQIALGVKVLSPSLDIANDQDGYRLSQPPPDEERLFTAVERGLLKRMRAATGYTEASELLQAGELTRLDKAATLLSKSDFLVPMLPAGYRLIGHPIAASTLRTSAHPSELPVGTPGREITLTLTQSGATKVAPHARVIYMPVARAPTIFGSFTHRLARWDAIDARANRIHGLSALVAALGVRPQETFRVTFDLVARTYDLGKLEDLVDLTRATELR
jgi:hypothetical protein